MAARVFALSLCMASAAQMVAQQPGPAGALTNPHAVGVSLALHKAYAIDQRGNALFVIDTLSGAFKRIAVGSAPDALAVDPANGRVYVANSGSGDVTVVDGSSNRVVATVKAGPHPYAIILHPKTHTVYVTNTFSDIVAVIDGRTNQVTHLKAGSADALAIDPASNRVFLLGYEDPQLRVLDGDSLQPDRLEAGNHLWDIVADATSIYVTRIGNAEMLRIDSHTTKVKAIAVGKFPCAVAISEDAQLAFVANYEDNTLSVIDLRNESSSTLAVGLRPRAVALDPARHRAYVANFHGDSVSIVDTHTLKVLATIPAGKNPYALAVDTTTGKVVVANLDEKPYTFLDKALPTVGPGKH